MTELANNHIEMEQLRAILRQQECFSLENAKHVILENAGQMSVLKKSDDDKALSIVLRLHSLLSSNSPEATIHLVDWIEVLYAGFVLRPLAGSTKLCHHLIFSIHSFDRHSLG